MYIATIYVLLSVEVIFLLLLATIILVIYVLKLKKGITENQPEMPDENIPVHPGISYAEYLQQALERNTQKVEQQKHIETEDASETLESQKTTDQKHSALLEARDMFLKTEKSASEHSENENLFWDQIYSGMKNILESFKTIEHETEVVTKEVIDHRIATKEKVFYIETQSKKVDNEVNKLKDIIYEQENTLSSLQKALSRSVEHEEAESDEIAELRIHVNNFERQLKDSRMCMEILELENERLQQELNEIESRDAVTDKQKTEKTASSNGSDLSQMREVLENQEKQIDELHATIDSLKLEAEQAERLKKTIKDFTRTSQEMMGCIAILEEENEHLKQQIHERDENPAGTTPTDEDLEQYKAKIKSMEQEIIKKDVAIAKLQDEFSSMEKEYLAMYEAFHGDN